MPTAVMLSVIMRNIAVSVNMLSGIMLNVVMLSVIVLIGIVLSDIQRIDKAMAVFISVSTIRCETR
jgi:hypothetical protein